MPEILDTHGMQDYRSRHLACLEIRAPDILRPRLTTLSPHGDAKHSCGRLQSISMLCSLPYDVPPCAATSLCGHTWSGAYRETFGRCFDWLPFGSRLPAPMAAASSSAKERLLVSFRNKAAINAPAAITVR